MKERDQARKPKDDGLIFLDRERERDKKRGETQAPLVHCPD